jgi:hypothetical protein
MFEFKKVTEVTCTNSNPRRELHGNQGVRALDLTFTKRLTNDVLDQIQDGLRAHHYFNAAAAQGQTGLPDELLPLPNLRFPKLNREFTYGLLPVRGYKWVLDFGLGDEESNITFEDCALRPLKYKVDEDGVVDVTFTVQYNGELLEDNETFGRLAGLSAMGKVHILLEAPEQLVEVKGKGWRSGHKDAPPTIDNGAPLFEKDPDSDTDDDILDPDSAEGRLAAAEAAANGTNQVKH